MITKNALIALKVYHGNCMNILSYCLFKNKNTSYILLPYLCLELQKIPPKNETALKVITNIFRIHPGGKRSVKLEDVIILMDGSGSIGECEFNNGKKAMKSLMQYKQSSINAKYAMVTFANTVRKDFDFLPQLQAATKIDDAKYPSGGTNTQAALAEAINIFKRGMIRYSCGIYG